MADSTNKPVKQGTSEKLKEENEGHSNGTPLSSEVTELMMAASKAFRAKGQRNFTIIADVLDYLMKHPEDASRLKKYLEEKQKTVSIEKATEFVESTQFSGWQYNMYRSFCEQEGLPKYPSYHKLLKANEHWMWDGKEDPDDFDSDDIE